MTITLEFNDDHDGLEMEMSEKKYSDPILNNPLTKWTLFEIGHPEGTIGRRLHNILRSF